MGTPLLSPHGHVKVAFCRETPEGGDQRRVAETEVQMSRQHLSEKREGKERRRLLGLRVEICAGPQLKPGHPEA